MLWAEEEEEQEEEEEEEEEVIFCRFEFSAEGTFISAFLVPHRGKRLRDASEDTVDETWMLRIHFFCNLYSVD